MSLLTDKKILLGISGSIAAYKVADWVRALRREDLARRLRGAGRARGRFP